MDNMEQRYIPAGTALIDKILNEGIPKEKIGMLVGNSFPFYSAGKVTDAGKSFLQRMIERAEELGFKVIRDEQEG